MTVDITALERDVTQAKARLRDAQRARQFPPVQDYALTDAATGAPVRLTTLFGGKPDLLVIHNMGAACRYCTLWADGLIGLTRHLENRAAFVLTTPDEPAAAKSFAAGRGWPFRVVSHRGTTFAADMGFARDGKMLPGASGFRLDAGILTRTGQSSFFGPGDDFCAQWPLMDLLRDGVGGWEPQYKY